MACEKETACCVRGDHDYKDTWEAAIGEVPRSQPRKIFVVKLYSCKIFSYVFCPKIFLQ